ncbi:MAG: hypothetical protein IT427_05520 [Pirellulales bacterium]|nr:hypothetical protein [Pirellulales bacterium]
MEIEPSAIQPRSRRRSACHHGGGAAVPLEDRRTRILIRVPWLQARTERKPKFVAANLTTEVTTAAASPLASLPDTREIPLPAAHIASPASHRPSYVRVDAPHATAPAPHSAAPAWSVPPQGKLAKLSRQPLIWAVAVVSTTIVVVTLLRSSDTPHSKRRKAPLINAAQQQFNAPSEHAPVGSAAAIATPSDDRVARRPEDADGSKKSRRGNASSAPLSSAIPDRSIAPQLSGLNRRSGINEPASISNGTDWPPSSSAGSVNSASDAPAGAFQVIDGPTLGQPPMSTVPVNQTHASENDEASAAARFTGNVHTTLR